jgi:MYXO-CTERM domain-containing protein
MPSQRRQATHRPFSPRRWTCTALALALTTLAGTAWGHVAFEGLEPGATFVAGSAVELRWVDTIRHQTTAYHLDFIPGAGQDAIPIASDIPAEQHTWLWQVPALPCADCSLHIIQDNVRSDYSATHPITIVADDNASNDADVAAPREITGMHLAPDEQDESGGRAGSAAAASAPMSEQNSATDMSNVSVANASESSDTGCAVASSMSTTRTTSSWWLGLLLLTAGTWARRRSPSGLGLRPGETRTPPA